MVRACWILFGIWRTWWASKRVFIVKKNIFKAQVGKELEEEMLKLNVNPCVYPVVCETPGRRWPRMTPEQQVTGWCGNRRGGVRRTWKQSKPTAWARRSDYNRTVTRLDALTQHHNKPTLCYFLAQPSRQTISSTVLLFTTSDSVGYIYHIVDERLYRTPPSPIQTGTHIFLVFMNVWTNTSWLCIV